MRTGTLPVLTNKGRELFRLHDLGWTVEALAARYGVSRRTVYRMIARRDQARASYCSHPGCPVKTPRRFCYYHARGAA